MCWIEHMTRSYGCGATTPVVTIAGIETNDISTTNRRKCHHMRMIMMDRLYDDFVQRETSSRLNLIQNNSSNAQRLPQQPLPEIDEWARTSGFVLCRRSTYFAQWRSTRHCTSDALHGRSTCYRVGTLHTYWGAWPGTWWQRTVVASLEEMSLRKLPSPAGWRSRKVESSSLGLVTSTLFCASMVHNKFCRRSWWNIAFSFSIFQVCCRGLKD